MVWDHEVAGSRPVSETSLGFNMNICAWHLCNNETENRFCGIKCKNKYHVKLKRKNIKLQAIEYKGGKCEVCGYNRCVDALEFHHIDPSQKDFSISRDGNTRSWDKIKDELDKCVLLCSNCHREEHAKVRSSVAQR